MTPFDVTPATVAAIVGLIMTILFAYLPGLRVWYAALAVERQALLKLGLLILATVVITILAIYGGLPTTQPVTWYTCGSVILMLIITTAPGTQALLPQTRDAKIARLGREAKDRALYRTSQL